MRPGVKIYARAGHGPNTPEKYAQDLVNTLGAGVTTSTRIEDLSDQQITKFAKKIKQVEGWTTGQEYRLDNMPERISEWLEKYPTRAERAAVDQSFAKTAHPDQRE